MTLGNRKVTCQILAPDLVFFFLFLFEGHRCRDEFTDNPVECQEWRIFLSRLTFSGLAYD